MAFVMVNVPSTTIAVFSTVILEIKLDIQASIKKTNDVAFRYYFGHQQLHPYFSGVLFQRWNVF